MVTAVAYTNFRKDLNKKTLRCVNALIRDTMCSPFTGLGKPEPLKWESQSVWSRCIDSVNRLVYMVEDGSHSRNCAARSV